MFSFVYPTEGAVALRFLRTEVQVGRIEELESRVIRRTTALMMMMVMITMI